MAEQCMLPASRDYHEVDGYLEEHRAQRILLVCGKSIEYLKIGGYFKSLRQRKGIEVVEFQDFQPNPKYESIEEGVKLFRKKGCDMVMAVGGGSAMDVAKCIKLFCRMDAKENFLQQQIEPNDVPLFVMPTTAGTGSEATRYAVIYYKGEKQSVTDESCIPSAVLLDGSVLRTLPLYQKKAAMLDALCHGVESFWSVNATDESKKLSAEAITLILEYREEYLKNSRNGNEKMLEAANIAGKAINITQTTAGHAMCYKLTTLCGIPHGHAAALCVDRLWPYLYSNTDKCIDPRGEKYLRETLVGLAGAMGCAHVEEAIELYHHVLAEMDLPRINRNLLEDLKVLEKSVNLERLKNTPVEMDREAIGSLYRQIFYLQQEVTDGCREIF